MAEREFKSVAWVKASLTVTAVFFFLWTLNTLLNSHDARLTALEQQQEPIVEDE